MVSAVINNNALAVILDSGSIENEYIIYTIRNELLNAGIEPWKSVDAEIFVSGKQTLVIARPSAPLCSSGQNIRTRRLRKER